MKKCRSMRKVESSSWSEHLFIEHANLFLRVFRFQKGTDQEAEGLGKILGEFHVRRKGRILDLPCGVGRHAIRLAKKGYVVTGIDFSELFIAKARADARRQGIASRAMFCAGDIRSVDRILKGAGPFDAILSLWSSIGYYGREEDMRLFKTLRNIATSDCLLIVDTVNRDSLILRSGQPSVSDLGSIELHEMPKLSLETSKVENVWRFYAKKGKDLKLVAEAPFSMRCYSLHEVKELLESARWRYVKSYGGYDLQPFRRESSRIIACC